MDARAERRDAAPGRGDDEPLGARRRWPGKNIDQTVALEPEACRANICPKSRSSSTARPQTVEFEHGKLPYSHHGKPESFLDVAKNFDVPLEHACGGSCACTTCHVIIREGDAEPERDAGRRGRSPRHGVGPDAAVAARLPGGHHAATSSASCRCTRATTCRKAAASSSASRTGRSARRRRSTP